MASSKHIKVLDHGYVQLVETWGSDARIVESARMSTQKGFLGWGPMHTPECFSTSLGYSDPESGCTCGHKTPGDEGLLRYMWEHKHSTPFEFAGATFEVQAPIMVFREWHRHRTQSYSEMSARYSPLPDVNYLPSVERCLIVPGTRNKQAVAVDGAPVLTHEGVLAWLESLADCYAYCQTVYQHGLDIGIPKELARLSVPVGRYSRMRASTDLRNWFGFLSLRLDPAAQWEIRQFAGAVLELLKPVFPRTCALFEATI